MTSDFRMHAMRFYVKGSKTLGELTFDEKNVISIRAQAFGELQVHTVR